MPEHQRITISSSPTITARLHDILASASREIFAQYRAVLDYARYLEDQVLQKQSADANLRLDFDEVCESSFHLRLIGEAIDALRFAPSLSISQVPLADLVQQTLIPLSANLDRRAMSLSTLEIRPDVQVKIDVAKVSHVLWLLLLGIIRYAEAESTLHLRSECSGGHAMLGIRVSELAPGRLTPDERLAHMERQLQRLTPHMFADTIRRQGNIELAQLLLQPLGGHIEIAPLSSYSCEIRLFLPL